MPIFSVLLYHLLPKGFVTCSISLLILMAAKDHKDWGCNPRPAAPMHGKSQGFTLIELIVVLVIVILGFAAIGINMSSGHDTAEIKAAARDISSALRFARGEALMSHEETTVNFDLEENSYTVSHRDRVYDIPKSISLSVVTAQSELTGQGQGNIRFFPDGSSTGGRVTLENEKAKWQIGINWLTGAAELSDTFDDD